MDNDLHNKLSQLSSQALVDFIASLYGKEEELDNAIDTLVLMGDSKALHQAFKKRVQSISRGRRFIDYNESYPFSRQLDALLDEIERLLLPLSPQLAFDIIDRFLLTAANVIERVDDSGGSVGYSYQRGVELWLEAACRWNKSGAEPCNENWPARVLAFYKANDYGLYDGLLPQSAGLLSEDELRQLAWRFENDARKAAEQPAKTNQRRPYNAELMSACIGLSSVAEALQDIELYERATLIHSPQPNGRQKASLAAFCLQVNNAQAALKWLEPAGTERHESDHFNLLDTCYQQLGYNDKLLAIRREHYQSRADYAALCSLLEVLPPEEGKALTEEAISGAEQIGSLSIAADLLLNLQAIDPLEHLLLKRADELADLYYTELLRIVEILGVSEKPLVCTLCYRALLEDILDRGYSKAYRHAAKYYTQLQFLRPKVDDYKGFVDAKTYGDELRAKHGRKRSFWSLV